MCTQYLLYFLISHYLSVTIRGDRSILVLWQYLALVGAPEDRLWNQLWAVSGQLWNRPSLGEESGIPPCRATMRLKGTETGALGMYLGCGERWQVWPQHPFVTSCNTSSSIHLSPPLPFSVPLSPSLSLFLSACLSLSSSLPPIPLPPLSPSLFCHR